MTGQDRAAVFAAVRARLALAGYYVISTALRRPDRPDEPGYHFDAPAGVLYREVPAEPATDQVIEIDGGWYIPHRRHLSPDALRTELASAGFDVLPLDGSVPGNVVSQLTPG